MRKRTRTLGKRTKRIRNSAAAAGVAALVGTSVLSLAFASSLQLSSPTRPSFADAARCSSDPATVTVLNGHATVKVPPECEGEEILLYVAASGQAKKITVGTGSGTITLPSGAALPDQALVTTDTWPLPTELEIDDPPVVGDSPVTCYSPGGSCEIVNLELNAWGWPKKNEYNFSGSIVSTSPTKHRWTLVLNLSSSDFPFVASGVKDTQGGLVKISSSQCSESPRTITVEGTDTWGEYDYVGGGLPQRNFQINGRLITQGPETDKLLSCP